MKRIDPRLTTGDLRRLLTALVPRSKPAAADWYEQVRAWFAKCDELPVGQKPRLTEPGLSRDTLDAGWLLYYAERALARHKVSCAAAVQSEVVEAAGPGFVYDRYGSVAPFGKTRRQLEGAGDKAQKLVRQLGILSTDGHAWLEMFASRRGLDCEEFSRFLDHLDDLPKILADAAAALVEIDNRDPLRKRLLDANVDLVADLARAWQRHKRKRPGCAADGPFARFVMAALACVHVKNSDPRRLITLARKQAHQPGPNPQG